MSAGLRRIVTSVALRQPQCQYLMMVRNMSGGNDPLPWNYIWQPGPYPTTPEAKAAAAKKYVRHFEHRTKYRLVILMTKLGIHHSPCCPINICSLNQIVSESSEIGQF